MSCAELLQYRNQHSRANMGLYIGNGTSPYTSPFYFGGVMRISEDNYMVIQGWMRTDLDLKGNDLLVYAIIYGFSQSENQAFTGSVQYLADWCGSTRQGIIKNLKNLMDKGLITRTETPDRGVNLVSYCATKFTGGSKLSLQGSQLSLHNNIADNKDKKESIPEGISPTPFEFGKKEPKKQSLYTKCMNHIFNFSDNLGVQDVLKTFLDSLSEMGKLKGENQFAGILKKLKSYSDNPKTQIEIVNYSLEHGYATFYEPKESYGGHKCSSDIGVHSKAMSKEQKERARRAIENGTAEKF